MDMKKLRWLSNSKQQTVRIFHNNLVSRNKPTTRNFEKNTSISPGSNSIDDYYFIIRTRQTNSDSLSQKSKLL